RVVRRYVRTALPDYLGTIFLTTALILALPLYYTHRLGVATYVLVVLGILGGIPASDLAIALVNRVATETLGPRKLPRFALREGVPAEMRTILVMPVLLTSPPEIERHLENLEVHYLANSDGEIYFALVSDWADAPEEERSGDAELLAEAANGITRLNDKYPSPGGQRFFLFHRKRMWNEKERKWIGWERKRGKLQELNRLLRGATDTTFVAIGGKAPAAPERVRYVVTVDADTRLSRNTARQLIGMIAHPLNRPEFDPERGRVVEGYGILQPRVTPTLPEDREGSLFQRVYSGPGGIDPYSGAVSDVYQDLFHEGSFTGKGIYDVDAFEAAMAGKVPDNAILSHDLFEGIFARTALASDIEFFEEFPPYYDVAASRHHRWARGDWQLLPWIFRRFRAPRSASVQVGSGEPLSKQQSRGTTIPALGRWKLLDNLRRSLSAPATILTLVFGWLLAPQRPLLWTEFVLATIAIPALIPTVSDLMLRNRGNSIRVHFRHVLDDFVLALWQIGLTITFLAHQAWLMSDAILRTLARLFITHRNLLQWTTAAQAKRRRRSELAGIYGLMYGSVAIAIATAAAMIAMHRNVWVVAGPFLGLWIVAPAIALWTSQPQQHVVEQAANPEDKRAIRLTARQTWRFFETFVTEETRFLPPDGFQEDPVPIVARRTSPTNIGLYLLSAISAHDFGWIGTLDTVDRLEATFATIRQMESYRGHLYNWYDTTSLRPLDPRYISSVDSGNLAGHLLALANACRAFLNKPFAGPGFFLGVEDAVRLAREAYGAAANLKGANAAAARRFSDALDTFETALDLPAGDAEGLAKRLAQLKTAASELSDSAATFQSGEGRSDTGVVTWADAAKRCVESHSRDAEIFLPMLRLQEQAVARIAAMAVKDPGARRKDDLPHVALPKLDDAAEHFNRLLLELDESAGQNDPSSSPDGATQIEVLRHGAQQAAATAAALANRIASLAQAAEDLFYGMDFSFLYEPTRRLLSIGYRVGDQSLDNDCYDLLASEARLASFIGIAKGELPAAHWFRLSRAVTPVGRGAVLISWSGSMFEYLMPALVMHNPANSLLRQTCELSVRRQIEYGDERGVPWGVSESAYNERDLHLTYQYSGFGVPGLGLKRGLADDLVIAPYATALAAMFEPASATRNLRRIVAAGGRGAYGFYESLDYTRARVPEGEDHAIVRAYFAHHQGMSIVAFANAVMGGAMRARFHAEPIVKATELLLQERPPREIRAAQPNEEEVASAVHVRELTPPVTRQFSSPHDSPPRTHLLSNGRYSVMLTAAGSGYSRWQNVAISRWREDPTGDSWGSYIYLRDVRSGRVWSAGYQPVGAEPDFYQACFYEDRAEIVRRDGAINTKLEVAISPEDDAELRRVSLTNHGGVTREIEVTSFAELAMAPQGADQAHPAFSNLFVQTEFVQSAGALLATRRKRSADESSVWIAHLAVAEGQQAPEIQFETDRAQFLGRGRDARSPIAIVEGKELSGTVGFVLDPAICMRRTVRLPPGATVRLVFTTIAADSREHALNVADKFRDPAMMRRTLSMAWTQAQVQLYHLGINADEANLFQRLANPLIYADPALRPASDALSRTTLEINALWKHGISGDLPILLVRINGTEDVEMVRQLLRAQEYWRMKQFAADVVIINEKASSYDQDLQRSLDSLVKRSQMRLAPEGTGGRGGIFVLRADQISPDENAMLRSVARTVVVSGRGTLYEQINRAQRTEPLRPQVRSAIRPSPQREEPPPGNELEFFNGLGGFSRDGREYVISLREGHNTPEPWINVIANPLFGFLASESGSGYTWSLNSHENQLTPWSNDPVCDPAGEVMYIRDDASGEFWTPTALPIRDAQAGYVTCHGQGYTRFEHESHGIASALTQFVPVINPIKISRLTLRNNSNRTRRLSVWGYVDWVLGSSRSGSAPYLITEIDPGTKALLARSAWGGEFGGRIAFADFSGKQQSWTGDRAEFTGRNGSLRRPKALDGGGTLSGRVGAALDPCGAMQTSVELEPGAESEVVFLLGQAASREEAAALVNRYRSIDLDRVLAEVTRQWDNVADGVQISTPDRAMDVLVNRWLLYQTLSCRVWGRTAFYQASGAFGFRDQLQDVMALCISKREVAREHLLRAASRQFVEGDVQHWWHPPSGRGVRTRISDDALWLPYALVHFLETTGDTALLDEQVPFLDGPKLAEGQEDAYFQPETSEASATLYEHCARALDRSLAVGSHGLPLMSTGDWNDGMNRVGREGKGESVWLGWFLHTVLWEFSKIADLRGEHTRAETWRLHVTALKAAIEREAWDGEWYRRAFYDDGTPLGSASNSECQIDSIAQSWGVITDAAERGRASRSMTAVAIHLISKPDNLVQLFTPPFDHDPHDPGYIKGYPPGVRENGGQYTHAAVWTILAFAALGNGDKAVEVFGMLNPIHRSSKQDVQKYKIEPYALAGDVCSGPHAGRGGWSWYSGSAGWLYRSSVEWILGVR
ncbi:MAG TPA: glucoamylase family protein, partial [Candidatus Acidoferrales bacterium]|nr:glucoamylase family protein [Candidatus Acidoferrales bacterium]